MIANDVLVYKKRYGEEDWEMFLKDVESSAAQSANAAESRLGDEGAADILSVFRGMIDRVPDEKRLNSSEEFIKKVRRFSRKYRVSVTFTVSGTGGADDIITKTETITY